MRCGAATRARATCKREESCCFLPREPECLRLVTPPGIEHNQFLATTRTYRDFILRLQVQLVGDIGNSGVQFRSIRKDNSTEMIGYQADIGPGFWGDLYDEGRRMVELVNADEAVLEGTLHPSGWNDYEIYASGDQIRLSLNGQVTADYLEEDETIPGDGLIAPQLHSGPPLEVRFRNIQIKELHPAN